MLPPKISEFISSKHLLSLAVVADDGMAYAASCFYAFSPDDGMLYIAGDEDSIHMSAALKSGAAAGTIALDTKIVGRIQGIQFRSKVEVARTNTIYLRRFPYAAAMSPKVFSLSLEWVKFTSNTLGFGKKLIWQRNKGII